MNTQKYKDLFLSTMKKAEAQEYGFDNYGRYYDTCRHLSDYLKEGARVIDIGIYPGHLALLIKNLFTADFSGISTTSTESFEKLMSAEKITLLSTNIENESLPLPDNSTDLVLATEVLEHVYNPHKLFTEAYRVLAPGGYFLLTSPNLARLKNRINFFFRGRPVMEHLHGNIEVFDVNDWTHKREYTWHEVNTMLAKVGFIPYKKSFTALKHFPSTVQIKIKNFIKSCIYLCPAWKGGLICTGKKPE